MSQSYLTGIKLAEAPHIVNAIDFLSAKVNIRATREIPEITTYFLKV